MVIGLEVLLGLASGAIAVSTFFIGRQSTAKKAGVNEGIIASDIRYIKDTVLKIEKKMDEHNKFILDHELRISALEKLQADTEKRIETLI